MEKYNFKYGDSIPEIIKNLGVETALANPDLSLENLTRAVKTHTLQTLEKGGKQYIIVEDCGEYVVAKIEVIGSAEDVADYIEKNDLGDQLLSQVI